MTLRPSRRWSGPAFDLQLPEKWAYLMARDFGCRNAVPHGSIPSAAFIPHPHQRRVINIHKVDYLYV